MWAPAGVQEFPRSAKLAGLLVKVEMRAHTASRMRRTLRAVAEAALAPGPALLTAATEAALPASTHRAQVPLKKDLVPARKLLSSCQAEERATI